MNIVGQTKPDLAELTHHGVKGMHWGVRKSSSSALPMHAKYKQVDQKADREVFGKRGVARINARMHEGKTHGQAMRRELGRSIAIKAGVSGALAVGTALATHGELFKSDILRQAQVNRNRNTRAAMRGIPRVASKINYAKQTRSGVYNIRSK